MIAPSAAWRERAPCSPTPLRVWLHDRGSLTARIRSRCDAFSVEVLAQRRARAHRDEGELIGVRGPELAVVRDVVLRCGPLPVVFAHSIVAHRHLRGPWRMVSGMGARPLGAALFADRTIERHPLAFRLVCEGHPLYSAAAQVVGQTLGPLWARRSLFLRMGAALLVTEVFLPGILDLAGRAGPRA